MKRDINKKAFSLIELVFVITVILIVAGIAIATYPKLRHNMAVKADKASAQNIVNALKVWYQDNMSEDQASDDFKYFISEKLFLKTIKLSELNEFNIKDFVTLTYSPRSLLDSNGRFEEKQDFYIGVIGTINDAKFIITVETEDKRLDSISESSTVNYDGTDIGVIYIES